MGFRFLQLGCERLLPCSGGILVRNTASGGSRTLGENNTGSLLPVSETEVPTLLVLLGNFYFNHNNYSNGYPKKPTK